MRKIVFYQEVLKLGANEASAQGFQNAYRTSAVYYFFYKVMGICKSPFCMGAVCNLNIGKSKTNNLPARTDLA
jgi:hypothetical protein